MIKHKVYRYLGRNGIITTPILIEGVNPIIMYRLIAGEGMTLTNGEICVQMIDAFNDELNNWHEIPIEDVGA
jgi:hypothetical protein